MLVHASGHVNEKNFVGLSVTSEGHIACGSEDNAVYGYHQALPMPITKLHFPPPSSNHASIFGDSGGDHHHPHFVSSVCWSWRGNTLIAANSGGTTQVMKLVCN